MITPIPVVPRYAPAALVAIAAITLLACGGESPTQAAPHLAVVGGAGQTDTAGALLAQPLSIELRGSDGAISGRELHFAGLTVAIDGGARAYTAYVAPVGSLPTRYVAETLVNTGGDGRASVLVQLGAPAGPAYVEVSDAATGERDTVRLTVTPGQPATVTIAPRDTTVPVGASFAMRTRVTDRVGNVVQVAPSFSLLADGPTLAAATVTVPVAGVARILAAIGGDTDTAFVRAPPNGTIVAFDSHGLNFLGLDGVVATTDASLQRVAQPVWTPDASEVVFEYGGIKAEAPATGTSRTIVADGWARFPRIEASGPWVHYSIETADGYWQLHRVRLDGTGDETITVGDGGSALAGTLSPDGGRMIFVRPANGDSWLYRLDLATHGVTALDVKGHIPRWSPTSDLVAFASMPDGALRVMASDGSQLRTLGLGYYYTAFDWSPDGRWIIARNGYPARLELINVATGIVTVVPGSTQLGDPAWKP